MVTPFPPYVLVGLWWQALGCPSSHRLPRARRRAACYSLLIFQWGKNILGLPSERILLLISWLLPHTNMNCASAGILNKLQPRFLSRCPRPAHLPIHLPDSFQALQRRQSTTGEDGDMQLTYFIPILFCPFQLLSRLKPGFYLLVSISHFSFLVYLSKVFMWRVHFLLRLLVFHQASNAVSITVSVSRLIMILL